MARIYKVILIGDAAVGKTTLRRQFMGEGYQQSYLMTLGADFAAKSIKISNDMTVTLQIWDIAGDKKFTDLRKGYYKNTTGMLVVFDLTKPETFHNVPIWMQDYLQYNPKLLPTLVIGNKYDLVDVDNPKINPEVIESYMENLRNWGKQHNEEFTLDYINTSAKDGLNVEQAFIKIASDIDKSKFG
jgi:small GTP-binding protein